MATKKNSSKGLTPFQLKRIENKFIEAVKKAKKIGLTISEYWGVKQKIDIDSDYFWYSYEGRCCPGGAILVLNQPKPIETPEKTLASFLKVKEGFIRGFTGAFDGSVTIEDFADLLQRYPNLYGGMEHDGIKLGQKLRKKFIRD